MPPAEETTSLCAVPVHTALAQAAAPAAARTPPSQRGEGASSLVVPIGGTGGGEPFEAALSQNDDIPLPSSAFESCLRLNAGRNLTGACRQEGRFELTMTYKNSVVRSCSESSKCIG